MRITLRLNQLDSHAHITMFINGAKVGDLCMRAQEYREFTYFIEGAQRISNVAVRIEDNRERERTP